MLLLLLATLSHADVPDSAFTSAELARRKEAFTKVLATAKAGEKKPACLALEDLSKASFIGAPPASCPVSLKNYNLLAGYDRYLRGLCADFYAWLRTNPKGKEAQEKSRQFHRDALGEGTPHDPDRTQELPELEQKKMDCALPVGLVLLYRKKAFERMQDEIKKSER